jgi:hypothetical protein
MQGRARCASFLSSLRPAAGDRGGKPPAGPLLALTTASRACGVTIQRRRTAAHGHFPFSRVCLSAVGGPWSVLPAGAGCSALLLPRGAGCNPAGSYHGSRRPRRSSRCVPSAEPRLLNAGKQTNI